MNLGCKIDYHPFGMQMPGRNGTVSEGYRYGFNGKENTPEINSSSYDFGARMYDARIGRFFSVDPERSSLTGFSPYHFAYNCPLFFVDKNGEIPTPYEMAVMSSHVYDGKIKLVGGWEVVPHPVDINGQPILLDDPKTGFKSQLYRRLKPDGTYEYAYVTAGTADPADCWNDVTAQFGVSIQYKQSVEKAEQINLSLGSQIELTFGGHSLGGGLATANALKTNRKAITFNPMIIPGAEKIALGIMFKDGSNLITNYIVYGEILWSLQTSSLMKYDGKTIYLYDWNILWNFNIPIYGSYEAVQRHTVSRVLKELVDDGYGYYHNYSFQKIYQTPVVIPINNSNGSSSPGENSSEGVEQQEQKLLGG